MIVSNGWQVVAIGGRSVEVINRNKIMKAISTDFVYRFSII